MKETSNLSPRHIILKQTNCTNSFNDTIEGTSTSKFLLVLVSCTWFFVFRVQGEHFQRKVLRVRGIVSGPVSNPKSSPIPSL